MKKADYYMIGALSILFLALIVGSSSVSAQTSDPYNIHLSWNQNVLEDSIVITWQTDSQGTGEKVYYDTDPGTGDPSAYSYSKTGTSHSYSASNGTNHVHDVTLTGLSPDTTYYYICGGSGNYSAERSFHTAPVGAESFTFVAGGDSRSGAGDWPESRNDVSSSMAQEEPSFVLHTGDYVNAGETDQSEWNSWFTDVQNNWVTPEGVSIPIISAIGNHEGDGTIYEGQFNLPNNERWYSLDYGNAHFTVLSTQDSITGPQIDWLKSDLEKNESMTWKFVVFHEPPYTSSEHESNLEVREEWCPIFENYGVDLVFAGHNHGYERSHPLKENNVVDDPAEGTTYVVTGGWGAPLYSVGSNWWTAYSDSIYHYCVVEIRGQSLYFEARDRDGDLFDNFEIHKSEPGPPDKLRLDSPSSTLPPDGSSTATITCDIIDSDGKICVGVSDQITFDLSGPGRLVGPNPVNADNGAASIELRAGTAEGVATVTASSPGLDSDSLSFQFASQWSMDGSLDDEVTKVGSNPANNEVNTLNAGWNGSELYLATESSSSYDHFIFLSDEEPSSSVSAPWGKNGSVWNYDYKLCMEESNGWSGWQDSLGNNVSSGFTSSSGSWLEGTVDLESVFGSVPENVWLAAAEYGTNDDGVMNGAIPSGDGDGSLEVGEWVEYSIGSEPGNDPPEAAFSYSPSSPHVGEQVDFLDASSDPDGSVENWSWDFDGDGEADSSVQDPSFSFGTGGVYEVNLTVTDDDGAVDSVSKEVFIEEINSAPTASFSYTIDGLSVEFSGGSSDPDGAEDIDSRRWDFGDGSSGFGKSVSHFYSSPGDYSVELTVTDDDGAADSVSKVISVGEGGGQSPVADFSYSTDGLSVDFEDESSDPDGSLVDWSWDFDDDGTEDSDSQNPSCTYPISGTFTVDLKVFDNSGFTDTCSKQVSVAVIDIENISDYTSQESMLISGDTLPYKRVILFVNGEPQENTLSNENGHFCCGINLNKENNKVSVKVEEPLSGEVLASYGPKRIQYIPSGYNGGKEGGRPWLTYAAIICGLSAALFAIYFFSFRKG